MLPLYLGVHWEQKMREQGPPVSAEDYFLRSVLILGIVPAMVALGWSFAWGASLTRRMLLKAFFQQTKATIERTYAWTGSAGGLGDCAGIFLRFAGDSRCWNRSIGSGRPDEGSLWDVYILDDAGRQAIAYPASTGFPITLVERSPHRQWLPLGPMHMTACGANDYKPI